MNVVREATPGATRICPHCKATILESESVCPACRHHLRAGRATARPARETFQPFAVTGAVHNPDVLHQWEYSVVVTVYDARGTELSRQVVAVGALHHDEMRSFTLAVEASRHTG